MVDSGGQTAPRSWPREAFRSFVELVGLTGLAITQPVLDVFGRAPDFFIYRQTSRFSLVAFALLVAVLPAAVLWEIEQLVGLADQRARRLTHLVFVGALLLLLSLQSLKGSEVASGTLLVALAVAVSVGGVLAFRRWEVVRTWVAYLALASVAFVVFFLTASEASDLLSSQDVGAAEIGEVARPTTVVMLQFDEWPLQTIINRDGRIDPELYPNLAELAGDGVWYRNATTAATYTTYAVPAALTGRRPDRERVAVASEYPESLFTLLASQFDLDVIETVTQLCPTNLCDGELVDGGDEQDPEPAGPSGPHGLGQLLIDATQTYGAMVSPDPDAAAPAATFREPVVALDGPDPETAAQEARGAAPAPRVAPPALSLQSVEDLLASIEEGEAPSLHYLHLLLPHTPYTFLPDGRRYSEDVGGLTAPLPRISAGRSEEPAAVAFEEQRLLLQASYTDSVVGRVMERLRDAGLYDDAIVVVTADHGVGLVPGGAVRAPVGGEEIFPENYPDMFYVPLVVKAPGLEEPGTVSDANVGTVDILPTIAAALGVDLPWEVDGIDLGAGSPRGPGKRTRVILLGGDAVTGNLSLGELVRYNGEAALAEVLTRHIDTLLRNDNPRYRIYDVDDAGEIVGAEADGLIVPGDSGVTASLDDPGALLDVDLSSGLVPTHLSADLENAGDGDLTVAIAVNGVVAAVSPTWASDDQSHHLEAMLVPDTFVDGANEIRLFVVGGTEGDRTLAPIALAG